MENAQVLLGKPALNNQHKVGQLEQLRRIY